MAPSVQQEPTETSNATAIERAVTAMRLMNGIEAKIASQSPLSREEINHLYQFDEPIYQRTRDDWPHGFYGDEDPDLEARINRYQAAQRSARETTLETLRGEYGHDTDWMLASYHEIGPRVQELLKAGATPHLLAEQLSPADRLKHFESLRSAGVLLDAREVYEAYTNLNDTYGLRTDVVDAFIVRYATELIDVKGVDWRLVSASLADVEEGRLEEVIENLLGLGIERWSILRSLKTEVVEERFQWLSDAGFGTTELLRRASTKFALDNFDELFQQDPEALRSLHFAKPNTDDQAQYIIALHRNGQPTKELLGSLNKGPHYSLTPQFESLVAAGIDINEIVETFSGDNESLIHVYAPWLMKNGADPEAIKAKFTPEGIISVFEALRKAGIEVDLRQYVDQLPASVVISRRFVLEKEEGLEIDYTAQLEAYEHELDMRTAIQFIEAGVDPKKVFNKLPTGSIANDYLVNLFVEAGIPQERVWKKVDKSMQRAAHWQALTVEDSTDEAFEVALRVLPVSDLNEVFDTIINRSAYINLIVERFAEKKSIDSRMRLLIEKGADPNLVVRSVSKGFWRLYDEAEWLLDNGVEASLLFSHLKGRYMTPSLIHRLVEGGVPSRDVFVTLDGDYIGNNFDKLIALGYDSAPLIKQVMAHKPQSRFVLKNMMLLNDAGYSADQLSGYLTPKEVVENIKELLLAGLSPALAIAQVMQVHRCSQSTAEEILSKNLGW